MGSGNSKKSHRNPALERDRVTHATSVCGQEDTDQGTSPLAGSGPGPSIATKATSAPSEGNETKKTSIQSRGLSNSTGQNSTTPGDIVGSMAESVEVVLCKEGEMKNGEMQEIAVENAKVLLVKDKGTFYAIGAKCTHYGASLAKGAYSNGIVRCPWHGACFNVENGDMEDFPGLDSIPRFQVKVENGDVKLFASKKDLSDSKRVKAMCPMDEGLASKEAVVIVGGGGAAASCAESLRQNNFAGRVMMITQETALPYDRPKLSKALDSGAEALQLRTIDFYEKNKIELKTGRQVTGVDREKKQVTLSDGSTLNYKYLVLATGGKPRKLTCPGAELKNVFYLRSPDDGKAIAAAVPGKHVAIAGSSFIGMEVAAWAAGKRPASVTVIDRNQAPYFRVFGAEIGNTIKKLFASHDVKFEASVDIERLVGDQSANLTGVVLSNGTTVKADLLIVGIGVEPATSFLSNCGIDTDKGYIKVNSHMQTSDPSVYACGDIAIFPLSSFGDQLVNVQHWQMALKHGKTAGQAIAGRAQNIKTVPFFWTVFFGKSLRYTGYGAGYDKTFIRGSLDEMKFVVYFLKNDKLVAVATVGRDPVASQIAECFRSGRSISTADINKNDSDDWSQLLTWTHL